MTKYIIPIKVDLPKQFIQAVSSNLKVPDMPKGLYNLYLQRRIPILYSFRPFREFSLGRASVGFASLSVGIVLAFRVIVTIPIFLSRCSFSVFFALVYFKGYQKISKEFVQGGLTLSGILDCLCQISVTYDFQLVFRAYYYVQKIENIH